MVLDVLDDGGGGVRHGTHLLAAASGWAEQVHQDELAGLAPLVERLLVAAAPLDLLSAHRSPRLSPARGPEVRVCPPKGPGHIIPRWCYAENSPRHARSAAARPAHLGHRPL